MELADRSHYHARTREMERQAQASGSQVWGGGRESVVLDADGSFESKSIRRRWFWQTLVWCGILTLLYFSFHHVELKREVDRLQQAQADMRA